MKGSVSERLAAYSVPEPNSGCLLWLGGTLPFGHGMIRSRGRHIGAHRAAWEEANGEIPNGMWVLHSCDVPSCINPRHLFLGTQADNNRDMFRKNRSGPQKRTHCPQGHPLTGDNVIPGYRKDTHRACRACHNRVSLAYYDRNRDLINAKARARGRAQRAAR